MDWCELRIFLCESISFFTFWSKDQTGKNAFSSTVKSKSAINLYSVCVCVCSSFVYLGFWLTSIWFFLNANKNENNRLLNHKRYPMELKQFGRSFAISFYQVNVRIVAALKVIILFFFCSFALFFFKRRFRKWVVISGGWWNSYH